MQKLFVDTNIVIDLLSKRELFYEEAQELFSLSPEEDADFIITRNKKDFNNSLIPFLTAREYMNK
jgi:predicted nucleic acid-binding protein